MGIINGYITKIDNCKIQMQKVIDRLIINNKKRKVNTRMEIKKPHFKRKWKKIQISNISNAFIIYPFQK